MVQRPAEHLLAEEIPVRLGVEQVLVPGLVYLLGGNNDVPRRAAQVGVPPILLDDATRVRGLPAVVTSQLGEETALMAFGVEVKGQQPTPEVLIGLHGTRKVNRPGSQSVRAALRLLNHS
jgi:hypothetical protein